MTGIASGKVLELDMKLAANNVKMANSEIATRIGIGKASRCTTVKPAGTTSSNTWNIKWYSCMA